MNEVEWTRAGALYLPMTMAMLAALTGRRRPRQFAGLLLSALWAATTLLAVQRVNQWAGWWSFPATGFAFCGMPTELYLGWVILWGLVPQLALSRLPAGWSTASMVAADLAAMPACGAVVQLGRRWLVGEILAVAMVLIPAILIARWTEEDSHLRSRAALQVATAGMLFLFLFPEVVFAVMGGKGWAPLRHMAGWERQALIEALTVLSLPGLAGVMEFAESGGGTPIPYDAPKRLVTSGIYRYIANPMQLSCFLVMLVWGMMLGSGWMVAAAGMSVVYSAGIARWDERQDLRLRFGADWEAYRAAVHDWRFRGRPYIGAQTARLYVAAGCGPCSEVRKWIEARRPTGMEIVDAETLPHGTIRRMRYVPGAGGAPVDGVRAMGRALEHLHVGWALAGATLRLPVVWRAVQMVMDASGLGPRTLQCANRKPDRLAAMGKNV